MIIMSQSSVTAHPIIHGKLLSTSSLKEISTSLENMPAAKHKFVMLTIMNDLNDSPSVLFRENVRMICGTRDKDKIRIEDQAKMRRNDGELNHTTKAITTNDMATIISDTLKNVH